MNSDGYRNVTARVSDAQLDLGWLGGITLWNSTHAVAMAPHQHPHIELIFCLKGELAYKVSGYGTVSVHEGTGIVMPARTTHVLQGGTDTPCCRLGLHIRATVRNGKRSGHCPLAPEEFAALHAKLKDQTARPFRLNNRTLDAVKELAALLNVSTPSEEYLGLIRTLSTLILFRTADILSHPIAPTTPVMMDEATTFLKAHCTEKIGVSDLVRRMGYGRTQLFAMFKRHTGLSPNEYLVRHRIRLAEKLLARKTPIEQVAQSVGFSSTSYFKSVFRKYTGRRLTARTA